MNNIGDVNGLKYLVVGCGFYGAVMAERIASVLGEKVLVIDRRDHPGGNSYSYKDPETGIEVHSYGSHIFHTSNKAVWDYISRFGSFNQYLHKVYSVHAGRVYALPINLHTINQFYGANYSPSDALALIENEKRGFEGQDHNNLEGKALSLIGKSLYEAFIKGYTHKQWGRDPLSLPPNIITRLPVRYNYNNRYFSDTWEGQPIDGYGGLFRRLLDHPNIELKLGVDYFDIRSQVPSECKVIYTGPIDQYFEFRFGRLGWRALDFVFEHVPVDDFQGTSVMNYADVEVPYTRIHEFKHYHPERQYVKGRTIICREYSKESNLDDTQAYPVNTDEDKKKMALYREAASGCRQVLFGGRLGTYTYVDMHQSVAMALNDFSSLRSTTIHDR